MELGWLLIVCPHHPDKSVAESGRPHFYEYPTNRALSHSSGYLTKLASLTFAIKGICLLQIHTLIAIERDA